MAVYFICAFFHVGLPILIPAHYNDFYLGAIILLSEIIFFILFHEFVWKKTKYYMNDEDKKEMKTIIKELKVKRAENFKKQLAEPLMNQ